MTNNTPCLRNKIPTLLTISATAIALLLLASPLVFSNILLQPAQAQTTLSFKTPIPANGTDLTQGGALTFDAQGDTFRSSTELYASGTYTITDISTGANSSGSISRVHGCCLSNPSNGDKISMEAAGSGVTYSISTSCSTSANNDISLLNTEGGGEELDFSGPVECSSSSSQGGGNTTSSSMTGTAHDSDGDGIHDSSDKCPHNSHHRCFKEGEASTTTTTQQQPSTSSSGTGNQTR